METNNTSSTNDPSVSETPPVSASTPEPKPQRHRMLARLLVGAVLVALLLLVAIFVWYEKATAPPAEKVTKDMFSTTISGSTAGVPNRLLQTSRYSHGVGVGYLLHKPTAASAQRSGLVGHASAAELSYSPAIFYTKQASDGTQVFALDTATKETKQLTHAQAGATHPVFASLLQRLAYAKASCSVAVLDMYANTDTVIQEGSQDVTAVVPQEGYKSPVCYTPAGWSPDASYLAVVGTYSTHTKDLGLVSFSDLYLYDYGTKKLAKVATPAGFNSLASADDVFWQTNITLAAHYVQRGQYAATVKEDLAFVDASTTTAKPVNIQTKLDLTSVQAIGKTMYVRGTDNKLYAGTLATGELQAIAGSDATGTFLLKTETDKDTVTNILSLDGQPGMQDNFQLKSLPVSGGAKTVLYTPTSLSAYLLGWGATYDDVVYMDVLSMKSEIHSYNLTTKTDTVLLKDLPLIQ